MDANGMTTNLSKAATTALIIIAIIAMSLGALLFWGIQKMTNDSPDREKLEIETVNAEAKLKRLTEQIAFLSNDTITGSPYRYEADLLFSVSVVDPKNIYGESNQLELPITIPVTADFYTANRDSTILKSETFLYGDPVKALNLTKITLQQKRRYAIER